MIHLGRGDLALDLDPTRGMLATSWRNRGTELFAPALDRADAVPRVDTLRGMALLAPWANRLPGDQYTAEGRTASLAGLSIERDDAGLPLHGTLTGRGEWTVVEHAVDAVVARIALDDPVTAAAFPFPGALEVTWRLEVDALVVTTTLTATGDVAVPACFGWHPYLLLPGAVRDTCTVTVPGGRSEPIGTTTVDASFALGAHRTATLAGPDRTIELELGAGYDALQVWMPAGEAFVCLEPMAAAPGALATGGYATARPGAPYAATFRLGVRGSG